MDLKLLMYQERKPSYIRLHEPNGSKSKATAELELVSDGGTSGLLLPILGYMDRIDPSILITRRRDAGHVFRNRVEVFANESRDWRRFRLAAKVMRF